MPVTTPTDVAPATAALCNPAGCKSWIATALCLLGIALSLNASADDDAPANVEPAPPSTVAVWGQFTNVTQRHNAFNAAYSGQNSLDPRGRTEETSDATLFLGVHPWTGGEFWINPEYDQGFGLSNTVGVAGFPSGEAYKIGSDAPYLRLPRAFYRQTIDLGGERRAIEASANQFASSPTGDSLTLTIGKFSVVDIFDTNSYAHDPRADFLNWSIIDAGAFDYAADSWGFTFGGAAEWRAGEWTLRAGLFALSPVPNGRIISPSLAQSMTVAELERRYAFDAHNGSVKVLVFRDHGHMGTYDDALAASARSAGIPSTAAVRKPDSKLGLTLNVEQAFSDDIGGFLRLSANNGGIEAYEFTEISRSLSLGAQLTGTRWARPADVLGVAMVQNRIDPSAQRYLEAGGIGILIGDGALRYGNENVIEAYYSAKLVAHVTVALDLQRIFNPAYNRDRGPVSVVGTRLHLEF